MVSHPTRLEYLKRGTFRVDKILLGYCLKFVTCDFTSIVKNNFMGTILEKHLTIFIDQKFDSLSSLQGFEGMRFILKNAVLWTLFRRRVLIETLYFDSRFCFHLQLVKEFFR
jgi:hypothetical protein